MPEAPNQASQLRKANWIGLRTLRQRPRLVDHMVDGEPIFEVRSVRMVLLRDADLFRRLSQCSKCERDVPGPVVTALADLDRPSHPVICAACVRAGSAPSRSLDRHVEPVQPRPQAPEAQADAEPVPAPVPEPAPDEPVPDAALEARLEATERRLEELVNAQRAESAERQRADEAFRALLRDGLAELRSQLAGSSEVEVVRVLRSEVVALSAAHDRLRADIQAAVDRRLDLLGQTRAEQAQPASGALDALERRIDDGLTQARFEVTSLEQQLHARVVALTQLVETQRSDLATALDDRLGHELAAVAHAMTGLHRARTTLEGRVDEVLDRLHRLEASVGQLTERSDGNASQLHALERTMQQAVDRVTGLVKARVESGQPFAARSVGMPDDLLGALEVQLHEAESRLAQMVVAPADDEGADPTAN